MIAIIILIALLKYIFFVASYTIKLISIGCISAFIGFVIGYSINKNKNKNKNKIMSWKDLFIVSDENEKSETPTVKSTGNTQNKNVVQPQSNVQFPNFTFG